MSIRESELQRNACDHIFEFREIVQEVWEGYVSSGTYGSGKQKTTTTFSIHVCSLCGKVKKEKI